MDPRKGYIVDFVIAALVKQLRGIDLPTLDDVVIQIEAEVPYNTSTRESKVQVRVFGRPYLIAL